MSLKAVELNGPTSVASVEPRTSNPPAIHRELQTASEHASPGLITYIGRLGVALIALIIWCGVALPVWLFVILRTMPTLAVRLVMDLYDGGGTHRVSRIDEIVRIWPRGLLAILRIVRGQHEPGFNAHCTPMQALIDTALAIPFYASLFCILLYAHRYVVALQSMFGWAAQ